MRKALNLLLFSVLILLSSCSSLSQMMQTGIEAPMWYPDGRSVSGAVCFVAQGSGAGAVPARDDAYNSLLAEVSAYLGYDVTGRYYRELSANQSVSEIALSIDSTFSTRASDGNVYYYILAYAEEPVISLLISEEHRYYLEMESRVGALRESALEYYRQNNDVEAINEILRAIEISAQAGITSEGNRPEDLLETATGWLSDIRIRLSRENSGKGSVRVRVVRDRGLLSPSVINAPIKAVFTVHTHKNTYEEFYVPFVTGSDGRFVFEEYYPPMTDSGSVVFSIDIDSAIARAERVTGEAFFASFRSLASSLTAQFDYSMEKDLASSGVLVIMDEFDENGQALESHWARDAFTSYLNQEGIRTTVVSMEDDNFESAIGVLVSTYSGYEWIVWSAIGLSDVPVQPQEGQVYVVEGYTLLLNTRTLEIVNIDEITRSVSWGEDRDACLEEAFSTYGSTAAVNMSPYF